ncbi:ABC transporter substrate-binding protein [Roseomonas hellenica]|uniref:ABC transporter substrate-binding protein n=1 Tax=Plastoroseomonas hellenica TaxID=2687306 RepID=A0ABS5ER81_9PROT|nr:ABC transporter substrate-binding protein [Plastoroseomonas hellenica]MBR0662810.1 ABC transporter substrate-binding protein [Plastoroseomonas hellenica]
MTMLPPLGRRAALAGAAGLGFASFAQAQQAETPRRGGTLRIATLGLDTADPHRHTGSIAVQQAYVEALTSIAANGTVEPFLAEAFEVSADGRVHSFRLREGVRFHDGSALTSAEVIANLERVKNRVRGGWLVSAMRLAESFEAPDARTVVIRMREPYAPLLNLLSELWILSPNSPGWDDTITRPIGTGPFTFGDWRPKARFVAPAFSGYWQPGRPYLAAVEFDLRDDADFSLALRAGDLHVASVGRDKLAALSRDPAIRLGKLKDTNWFFVSFNNRSPRAPFDDLRVRQAIAYSLDKRAFMNFTAGQDGIVTNQMVIPGNVHFDRAMHDADAHVRPDPDRARALLREAGVTPAQRRIELVSWQESYAQVAAQMVTRLGFPVNHVALDDLGAQRRLGQYDWDLAVFSSGPRADLFLRYVRMMSDGPNPVLWGGVQDPEFDALVNAAVREPDQARRAVAYNRAWQRVLDRYYTVVLGHSQNVIANRSEVQGWDPGFTWACHWASGGVAQAWLAPRNPAPRG